MRSRRLQRESRDIRRGSTARFDLAEKRSPSAAREVIFGVEPIRELLRVAPAWIRVLYVNTAEKSRFTAEVGDVRAAGGEISFVDRDKLREIAGAEARHQGLAAQVQAYAYANLESLIEDAPDPLVLVDGVTDPRNLGAILRSAECAGVNAVILARDRTSPVTPTVAKTSAGAWIHLRIARCGNVAQVVATLKEHGYWTAALAPDGETSLYELDIGRRLAIIVGSESQGVRPIVRKQSDFGVRIPMYGQLESLNVSVATAVALFDIRHRRGLCNSPLAGMRPSVT